MIKPTLDDSEHTGGLRRFNEILTTDCIYLFKVNLLTVLWMLPVVTIPPALMAMHVSIYHCLTDTAHPSYWAIFRQYFRRSYGVFGLAVLLPVIAASAGYFYASYAAKQPLFFLLCVFCIAALLISLLSGMYLYPLAVSAKLSDAIPKSIVLGCGRPARAMIAAFINPLLTVAAIGFLPLTIPYFLLGGLAFPALFGQFLLRFHTVKTA